MRSTLFKLLLVLASLFLHHQVEKYLRLPRYRVSSRNYSLCVSVSQQSSRDHYKHREAKAGLHPIPMVLPDPHVGKIWQRWILLISTVRTNMNSHCNSSTPS